MHNHFFYVNLYVCSKCPPKKMDISLFRDLNNLVASVINLFAAAQEKLNTSNLNHIQRLTKLLNGAKQGINASNQRMLENEAADACAALEAVYESQDPGDMKAALDCLKSLAHDYKQYKGCKKEAEIILKQVEDLE